MNFVFPPSFPAGFFVACSDALLLARRMHCIGRNQAAHAREVGVEAVTIRVLVPLSARIA